jgi:hypothetical protein
MGAVFGEDALENASTATVCMSDCKLRARSEGLCLSPPSLRQLFQLALAMAMTGRRL